MRNETNPNLPVKPSSETLEWLKNNYTYDSITGLLKNHNRKKPLTGTNKNGYVRMCRTINGKIVTTLAAHHAAWYLYYGEWPSKEIDHINRVRHDNRIENLRQVTRSEQLRNMTTSHNNITTPGVTLTRWGKYQAQWRLPGHSKQSYIGHFETEQQAKEAIDKFILDNQ